ncbi:MAG: class II aldolase/adducin family protein [Candidatus Firestonebacteria bacterium]
MLEELKEKVCAANKELLRRRLVSWQIGNVSGRDKDREYVVIKPEGVDFEDLTTADMVVTDLNGEVVEGKHEPCGYIFAHCYVYKKRADIFGITHTHSTYASSYALQGQSIRAKLIPQTGNLGGDIPVTKKYDASDKNGIGRALVAAMKTGKEKAVILRKHGIFAFGGSAMDSVKNAVLLEDLAKTYRVAGR